MVRSRENPKTATEHKIWRRARKILTRWRRWRRWRTWWRRRRTLTRWRRRTVDAAALERLLDLWLLADAAVQRLVLLPRMELFLFFKKNTSISIRDV